MDQTSLALPDEDRQPASPDKLPLWEIITLLIVESLLFLLFAVIGRTSHSLISVGGIQAVINTAMPFIIAWIVVGIFTGAYRGQSFYPWPRALGIAALTALIAGPLGVVLRQVWLQRDLNDIAISFVLVATGVSTLLLSLWRLAWSRVRRWWWTELP